MGQAFPELVRAEPLITEVLRLEETRFRDTLERGRACSRRRPRTWARALSCLAQPRPAVRHLRLSARSHPGCAARPRHDRRSAASMRPWSASAPRRGRAGRAPASRRRSASGRGARDARRDRNPRLRAREREAQVRRWWSAAAAQRAEPGDVMVVTNRRRSTGGRRSVGDTARCHGPRRWCHGHPEEARRSARARRQAPGRRARGRRLSRWDRWRAPGEAAPRDSATICSSRRCAGDSLVSPRKARWWRPTGCASTSAIQAATQDERRDRGRGQRVVARERRGRGPADGPRRGDRSRAMALFGEKYGDEVRVVFMARSRRPHHLGRAVRRHALRAAGGRAVQGRQRIRVARSSGGSRR